MSPKCISIYLRFNPQARESLIYAAAIRCSFTASFNPQARESLISTAKTFRTGYGMFQSAGSREPDRFQGGNSITILLFQSAGSREPDQYSSYSRKGYRSVSIRRLARA